jgi:transketolase
MPDIDDSLREDGSPDRLAIDTIRTLAMDAVQKANSGHPGTPMALAPVAYTLWRDYLRYDPGTPDWPNRDRFVLSVGHASMLLYALLHLADVREIDANGKPTGEPAVSLEDIKQFRQMSSNTPGHHRSARPGLRQFRRHGDRRAGAGRQVQPRRLRPVRP